MQTLRLIFPGSYYDSQIYSGRLYLWNSDGSIVTIDWDKLIEGIKIPDPLRLALTCAFQRSEYLYGDHWKLVFQDTEIRTAIQRKFKKLIELSPIEISSTQLRDCYIQQQDNPLSFPHADCTIYNKTLYLGSQSGVLSAGIDKQRKYPISRKPEKIWDGIALSVAASYQTLAISAGNDGLFEYDLGTDYWSDNRHPRQRIRQHSNFARWLYASIFSSSYFNEGYLADFVNIRNRENEEKWQEREFLGLVSAGEIFGHGTQNGGSSLTWGLHDKICLVTPKSIEVVQYSPYKQEQSEKFRRLGEVPTGKTIGEIVSGDSTEFGFIIESDEGLLVINSLMKSVWIKGEPVNWRVFPRSIFYTNQLHVIYEDHLCIYSFNHDYFVDQKTKVAGIRHRREFPFAGRK